MKTTMMNRTVQFFSAGAILLFGMGALAQQAGSYQINVARSQGDISCTLSTTNSGSADCTTNVKAQASDTINMVSGSSAGYNGYVGTDSVSESGVNFVLVAVADESKQIKDIVLMQYQSASAQSFDGSLTAAAATSPAAVIVDPLHIEKVDAQTVKVQLSFVAYSPSSAGATLSTQDKQNLTQRILAKVRPIAMAVAR